MLNLFPESTCTFANPPCSSCGVPCDNFLDTMCADCELSPRKFIPEVRKSRCVSCQKRSSDNDNKSTMIICHCGEILLFSKVCGQCREKHKIYDTTQLDGTHQAGVFFARRRSSKCRKCFPNLSLKPNKCFSCQTMILTIKSDIKCECGSVHIDVNICQKCKNSKLGICDDCWINIRPDNNSMIEC